MADLAASEGADCGLSEKLRCDQDEPETLCSEALKAPYSHEGGGDCAEFKTKPTDAEANSSSENQKTVACAGGAPSCSTPVTVETEDAQCLSKTDIDPFIDSPESSDAASKNEEREEVKAEDAEGLSKTKDPFIESPEFVDPASKDPKERKDVKDRGSGEEKSENESGNDKASPTSDPEKEEAVLVREVAETSALHAPAGGASCEQGKEEPGLVKPVIDSVTDSSRPDDDTGEDSDHFEDAPTGPDKDDYEGDNANSVSSPLSKEATQHDEVTGDSGQQKYEDACFELDKDKLKGDEAKPSACPVEEEQVPDSLPADSPPQHEDTSFHGPDVDPPVVAQVEKIPAVPVDEVDSTTSGEQLPDGNPDETPVVPVASPNGKGQVGEGTHVNSSCSPPQDVQGKSWADDEPLAAEPSGQKDEAIPDLEGGHEATGLPSSPGHPGDGSEEEAGEELELHATQLDELDYDSGIMESGTTGPGEEVEEEEEEDCIEGERQQGDGEESVDPSDVVDKELDFDEDKRNPQYIPKKGAFYQHDDRMVGDEEVSEVQEEKKEDDKGSQKNKKKLWQDDGLWAHDMFNADEQSPKTKEELVATYGYDIRSETMPPRARRRRRYGRGPNKYQRNWEDEDAYSARPGFGRGGGTRGGHRGRGGHGGNPSFRDEDFPDLNAKPPSSEGVANRDRTEMHVPAHKPFKGPEHRISDGPPPQQDWDHSARSSGQGRRGWGKRPQAPRRASDGSPKRPENEPVKEVAPLSQRGGSKPAPRPSLKASEPLPHGAASKVRAGKHTPTEQERNVRGGELSDKPVSKGDVKTDVKEGGNGADSKSTAVVAPRTGPLGSTETTAKPKRYSSLRQRPMAEATSYTQEPGVVAPQMASTQAPPPPPGPNPPQPAILTPAHFQGPYSPYPEGYMLPPPGQAPAVLPPQNQPPPVMAPPGQIPGSYLPAPTGLVSFPPQYPPPYTFPAQYAPPAPAAPAVSHVSGANIPASEHTTEEDLENTGGPFRWLQSPPPKAVAEESLNDLSSTTPGSPPLQPSTSDELSDLNSALQRNGDDAESSTKDRVSPLQEVLDWSEEPSEPEPGIGWNIPSDGTVLSEEDSGCVPDDSQQDCPLESGEDQDDSQSWQTRPPYESTAEAATYFAPPVTEGWEDLSTQGPSFTVAAQPVTAVHVWSTQWTTVQTTTQMTTYFAPPAGQEWQAVGIQGPGAAAAPLPTTDMQGWPAQSAVEWSPATPLVWTPQTPVLAWSSHAVPSSVSNPPQAMPAAPLCEVNK